MSTILTERIAAKLSLRELASLVGLAASTLSMAERGLFRLQPHDEERVIQIIRRVATLARARKEAVEAAKEIDLKEFTTDIREGRAAAV